MSGPPFGTGWGESGGDEARIKGAGKGKGPGKIQGKGGRSDDTAGWEVEDSDETWGSWNSAGKGSNQQGWHSAEWEAWRGEVGLAQARTSSWSKGSWADRPAPQPETEPGPVGPPVMLTLTDKQQQEVMVKRLLPPPDKLPPKIRIGPAKHKHIYTLKRQEGDQAGCTQD